MKSSPSTAPAFVSFDQLEKHLEHLDFFLMTPGLERISAVLKRMGLKRPPYVVVQVAGTNGKGSTAVMLAGLTAEHGLVTGLYTSPHFLTPRERIRINGEMLSAETWASLGSSIMAVGGEELSYFEFVTALAVLAFAEAGVEVAIMETGLGGTHDAVSALAADLVLLTPMALDHQSVLGGSLREIAQDKAGAIRAKKPVMSAPQAPEAWKAILSRSGEMASPLFWVEPAMDFIQSGGSRQDKICACNDGSNRAGGSPLPRPPADRQGYTLLLQPLPITANSLRLHGEHQKINACLALAAWRRLSAEYWPAVLTDAIETAEQREASALEKAWMPGRQQYVPATENPGCEHGLPFCFLPGPLGWPPMILDGAHNAHGLASLGLNLAKAGIGPGAVIFTCLQDKISAAVLNHLRALATGPIFVPALANNPRAADPEELAARIGLNAVPVSSVREALEQAARNMAERLPEAFGGSFSKNPLLVCGSLYLLAEVFALRPRMLEQADEPWPDE